MQTLRKLFAVLALALPAAHALALGSPYAIAARCDGCTATQMHSAAQAIAYEYKVDPVATAAGYAGFVYVYDYNADTLMQYGAFLSQKQGGFTATSYGTPSASISAAFHKQTSGIRGNGGSLVFTYTVTHPMIPGAANNTVYDIVQTSSYQNSISAWLLSNANVNEWSIVAAAETILLAGQQITVDIIIELDDHSKVNFEYTAGAGTKFKLKEGTDMNGNNVPLVAQDVPGHYIFSGGGSGGTGAQDFMDYIHGRFGYNIGASCVNGTLACVDSPAGRSCTWVRCF